MSGSGQEAHPTFQEWSGNPPGLAGVVESPPPKVWEAIPDVREWSEDPPGCQEVVGRPSLMFGSGRKAHPNVWE